jgi:hypothetical protein
MYTRKHHKRTVQSGGATPDGKIPLPLMTKGERFIRDAEDMVPGGDLSDAEDKVIKYRGQRHGSRGSMSDMISVLHQSVSINAKGGDC